MKTLSTLPSNNPATRTVMETIMKPLNWTRSAGLGRPGRWLAAAAMALGLSQAPAWAEDPVVPMTNYIIDLSPDPDKAETAKGAQDGGATATLKKPGQDNGKLVFTKTGQQIDCDYVVYNLNFTITRPAETWTSPVANAILANTKIDLADKLPAGLGIVSATVSGDVTNAAGTGAPLVTISTSGSPNDTATMADFRLSPVDLDGDGSLETRSFDVKITAKIDRAAFPAATTVDNQAVMTVTPKDGTAVSLPSHDPSLPDDGSFLTGEKTTIAIDVTKCTPPGGGDQPKQECFKVDTGTVDCDKDGAGAFIYHMNVGADMAGRVIELSATNPGVTIASAAQVVPAGGGVLNWTITGAMPGDVVHIVVVGIETYAGPEEGWGICCTQTIDIKIPENLDCPKKHPDIKIEKKADVETCTPEGGCKFTIRVSNVGDAPYNGPIVLDEVTLPGNATIDGGPNAPWTCAPATSPMLCSHPATTLNPGDHIDLNLSFKPGPAWNARFIKNCAKYNYEESGKTPFGNKLNDRACASIDLCDPQGPYEQNKQCQPPVEKKADLQLRKAAREYCNADGICMYIIAITNVGTETYNGPLTVTDAFPGGAPTSATFAPTPPWVCQTVNPAEFKCDHPGLSLAPGATTPIVVKAVVPLDYPNGRVENCANLSPVPNETNLTNNKQCATAKLRQPEGKPALRITKVCQPGVAGGAVSCRITVNSVGTSAPVGPVRVNDAATIIGSGAPVNLTSVTPDGADWSCTALPADSLSCQIPGAVMTPGNSRYFDVTVQVRGNQRFENCARGSYGPAPGNDIVYPFGEACDQGGTDITVRKTGDKECQIGQPCAFTVTISNNGDSDFSGPVQIGDAIEIDGIGRLEGVAIQSIVPPFGCAPEPTTLPFGCTANISIPAGASQPHVVTVVIPDSEALANVTPNGVSGRNCVGVTGEQVSLTPAINQAAQAQGPYACHPFTLVKKQEEKLCSQGFVMNGDGRCVCPEGTSFSKSRNSCVGETAIPLKQAEPETPQVTQPKLCKLLPGMIRTKENRCICPKGTELRDGACKKPPVVQQCKLLPGMIRTKDNRCICPKGTTLGKKGCFKVEIETRQCKLLPGQIRTKDGLCVCPRGTVLGKRGCVKVEQPQTQCPRGTKLIDGECIAPIDRTPELRRCPKGTVGVFPLCVDPDQLQPKTRQPTIEQKLPRTFNQQGNDLLKQ